MVHLDFIKDLIKIDSSSKQGANKALDFCAGYLAQNNMKHRVLENTGYKMLTCSVGTGDKKIILNGHLDVVEAKEAQFIPKVRQDKLYGRGAADMKAAVVSLITVLGEFTTRELPYRLELQLVTDEETGGENCSRYLADSNPNGDFVICGEPTNLGIGVQAKGILQIDIIVNGKSAHGSRPWEGDNAIIKAYKLFDKINSLPFVQECSDILKKPSINLSKIEGGMVYNKVPDCCVLSLDIRFLPQQSREQIIGQIKRITDNTIEVKGFGQPVVTSDKNVFVRSLARSIERHIDDNARILGQHGSSDTRFFSKHGIPAVEFGPCGDNWHGDNEHVILSSIEKYEEILIDFLSDDWVG